MPASMSLEQPYLLALPPELRFKIFSHVIGASTLKIEAQPESHPTDYSDLSNDSTPRISMAPISLSSQLLRVCKQIYAEALPMVYASATFDCSARSSIQLLTSTLTPSNFGLITSLVLDWDQLLDFSFQLAKPSFAALFASVTNLALSHWRTRMLSGSPFLWRDVKAYERSICQSAFAITTKTPKLRLVAQRHWLRPKSMQSTAYHFNPENSRIAAKVDDEMKKQKEATASIRVKWRFLADESQLVAEETVLDLEGELALLMEKGVAKDEGPIQLALDPI